MPQMTEAYGWHGRKVVDKAGEPVGKIEEIFEDQLSGQPEWALVHTGLFGSRSHLVPLTGAAPDGEDVRVQVLKEQVDTAPTLEATEELSPHLERRLFAHYDMHYAEPPLETAITEQARAPIDQTANGRAVDDGPVVPTASRPAATRAPARDLADQPAPPRSEPGPDSRAGEARCRSPGSLRRSTRSSSMRRNRSSRSASCLRSAYGCTQRSSKTSARSQTSCARSKSRPTPAIGSASRTHRESQSGRLLGSGRERPHETLRRDALALN